MILFDTAVLALDHGLAPIPAASDGTKRPGLPSWKHYQTSPPTLAEITGWFDTGRYSGLGIVCGAVSGNLEMLEFEGRAVQSGLTKKFVAAAGAAGLGELFARIVAGYSEITPSGGVHLLYRCEEISGNLKLAQQAGSDGLEVLIETRGEGGFVIVAPSNGGTHPSGRPWQLAKGAFATIATITVDERRELLNLARSFDTTPPVPPTVTRPTLTLVGDRPGDRYTQNTTWAQILEPHGWAQLYQRDGIDYWRRPGKTIGISATTNSCGTDRLKVFSTSTPFPTDGTFDRFAAYAILNHGGDMSAAARQLTNTPTHPTIDLSALIDTTNPEIAIDGLPVQVDWAEFWKHDISTDWLIEPVIPAGRHVVLYAPAKMGKSLLALEMAAAAATGRPVLSQAAQDPVEVSYVDLEMTADDLQERMAALGYDETGDLGHLHYYLLPDLPPLDTPLGGAMLMRLVQRDRSRLVVIDTMARVVQGDENDADSYRRFDMYASRPLKKLGVAVLRLDHSGKDIAKGQRGSSEKVGYADVVWQLAIGEGGSGSLTATHQRLGWVPSVVPIRRIEDPELRHRVGGDGGYPAGTADVVRLLDELEIPVDATSRTAERALRKAGEGRGHRLVGAALKWRKRNQNFDLLMSSQTPQTAPGSSREHPGAVRVLLPRSTPPEGGAREHPEMTGEHLQEHLLDTFPDSEITDNPPSIPGRT